MKIQRHTIAKGALICACIFAALIVQGAFALEIETAPQNPEFVEYINNLDSTDENRMMTLCAENGPVEKNYPMGLVPSPVTVNWSGPANSVETLLTGSEPENKFDLREDERISPIQDQGNLGACWAFATYGALESNLRPDIVYDFSENNLKNTHGYDWTHEDGGNAYMSSAYLTRWSGPVTEKDDPYNELSGVSPKGLKTRVHVQNVTFFEPFKGPESTAGIKKAIKDNGAIYHALYWNNGFYNKEHTSYYDPYLYGSGHAIVLVGWDDSYSKENFNYKPPGDGAFIARNSWGENWGDEGYFYISYYNKGKASTQFLAEPTTNYGTAYQYDELGWTADIGIDSTTVYAANVFTAQNDDLLGAVGFYTTMPDEDYEVFVYLNPEEGEVTTGTPVLTMSGHMNSPGYHTLPVDSMVSLTKGEDFSVVVKLTDSWYKYPVAVEKQIPGYSSRATAHPGESYISRDGTDWEDLTDKYPNTNACIKTYTRYPSISFDSESMSVRAGSSSDIAVLMSRAPQGIAGYNMKISLSTPDVAKITDVHFPGWAILNETSEDESGSVTMKAVDLGTEVQDNAKDVIMGTLTVTGLKEGTSGICVTVPMLTADGGDSILPDELSADITVKKKSENPGTEPVASGEASFDIPEVTDNGNNTVTVNKPAGGNATIEKTDEGIKIKCNDKTGWDEVIINTEGEPVVNADHTISGRVAGVTARTKPVSGEINGVGVVSTNIELDTKTMPASDAEITADICEKADESANNAFILAAKQASNEVADIAYVMNVYKNKVDADSGSDILNEAFLTMTIDSEWVAGHGGRNSVVILRRPDNGGDAIRLETEFVGTSGSNDIFRAKTDKLCVFAVVGVITNEQADQSRTTHGNGGGHSDADVAVASDLHAGDTESFVMKESAFSEVNITAKTDIPEMMILVSDIKSLPKGVNKSENQVYRYVEARILHTPEESIESGSIVFAVPENWLKEHAISAKDVELLRDHNNAWQNLPTEFREIKNGKAYFHADTDAFSYFAIAVNKDAAKETPVQTPDAVQTGDETNTTSTQETDTPKPAETQKSPLPLWVTLTAAGAAMCLRRK